MILAGVLAGPGHVLTLPYFRQVDASHALCQPRAGPVEIRLDLVLVVPWIPNGRDPRDSVYNGNLWGCNHVETRPDPESLLVDTSWHARLDLATRSVKTIAATAKHSLFPWRVGGKAQTWPIGGAPPLGGVGYDLDL
jgi:hypothetical protein